jgi:hypothetical protein
VREIEAKRKRGGKIECMRMCVREEREEGIK